VDRGELADALQGTSGSRNKTAKFARLWNMAANRDGVIVARERVRARASAPWWTVRSSRNSTKDDDAADEQAQDCGVQWFGGEP